MLDPDLAARIFDHSGSFLFLLGLVFIYILPISKLSWWHMWVIAPGLYLILLVLGLNLFLVAPAMGGWSVPVLLLVPTLIFWGILSQKAVGQFMHSLRAR